MKGSTTLHILKKYRHTLIIPIYGLIYLICFYYLEQNIVLDSDVHIIHMRIDDYIPFCEYFIVPYMLWFLYIVVTVIYFIFQDKKEYYQLIINLFTGMSLFLIISYVYPNGQTLRPDTFIRDNIFVEMVRQLYSTDTPTNILPSIHVFNSLAALIAILRNRNLQKHKWILYSASILTTCIIMATVFLKQHSVMDVITGILLSAILYIFIYKIDYSILIKPKEFSG